VLIGTRANFPATPIKKERETGSVVALALIEFLKDGAPRRQYGGPLRIGSGRAGHPLLGKLKALR
jgi:hypothetical protein